MFWRFRLSKFCQVRKLLGDWQDGASDFCRSRWNRYSNPRDFGNGHPTCCNYSLHIVHISMHMYIAHIYMYIYIAYHIYRERNREYDLVYACVVYLFCICTFRIWLEWFIEHVVWVCVIKQGSPFHPMVWNFFLRLEVNSLGYLISDTPTKKNMLIYARISAKISPCCHCVSIDTPYCLIIFHYIPLYIASYICIIALYYFIIFPRITQWGQNPVPPTSNFW